MPKLNLMNVLIALAIVGLTLKFRKQLMKGARKLGPVGDFLE